MSPYTIIIAAFSLAFAASPDGQPTTPTSAEATPHEAVQSAELATARIVDITVDGQGFHPNHVSAKKGVALKLRFKRTSDKTCAKDVVFPELGIKKPLPLNQVVAIDVPVDKARTLAFQCGMGMYKSSVVIN